MKSKIVSAFTFTLFFILVACGSSDDGGNDTPEPPPSSEPSIGTITGSVSGTIMVAVNGDNDVIATDDTTGKTADSNGNFPFSLSGIPTGSNFRIYLISGGNIFPVYFDSDANGSYDTNVFALTTAVDVDLGYVDTSLVAGKSIPENNPTNFAGVVPRNENLQIPVLPGGPMTVEVRNLNTEELIAGATVIVDHSSDPRQEDITTLAANPLSFTMPSAGPVTITITAASFQILTITDINQANPVIYLDPQEVPSSSVAYVEGTASNFSGSGTAEFSGIGGNMRSDCPTPCQNLEDGTIGYFKFAIEEPDYIYAFSAFDLGSTPPNFFAITDVGPMSPGETVTVNFTFPDTAPDTTVTTGTMTAPSTLGSIVSINALGISEHPNQSDILVGGSTPGNASPFTYSLTTFEYGGGVSNTVYGFAEGENGESTKSLHGRGFGDTAVDMTLIDVPTLLSPGGDCISVTPTFSWSVVPGASYYSVHIESFSTDWEIVVSSDTTSVTLPDLTGSTIASQSLVAGDTLYWEVTATIVPEFFYFDSYDLRHRVTDHSRSSEESCMI